MPSGAFCVAPLQDDNGMVDSMLNACLSTTARITDAVVSRLVDALQSVAPPQAPRSKVSSSNAHLQSACSII